MTIYNTYQEAKIVMPNACICVYKNDGKDVFTGMPSREGTTLFNGAEFAEPQDYCMTVEKFLADGHKFVEGDAYLDRNGDVEVVGRTLSVSAVNETSRNDKERYILRAAALENIPTETPEEKEVLDGIESAGEVEWKNGDSVKYHNKHEGEGGLLTFVGIHPTHKDHAVLYGKHLNCGYMSAPLSMLSKPETPQQREDRERLEAAYDLYCDAQHAVNVIGYDDYDLFKKNNVQVNFWLAIVDKTNYRKEKTHGAN